jgi:OmpA-OmpF porin, OOP family
MKRHAILCSAILALTAGSLANAATPGAYAGLGLGGSKATLDVFNSQQLNVIHSLRGKVSDDYSSLSGRVYGGYNFNEYFGLEAGYNAFGTSKQTVKIPGSENQGVKYKLSSFDVRGKAYLPLLDNNANVYAIAGLAYAKQDVDSNVKAPAGPSITNDLRANELKSNNRVRPVFGIGGNYNVSSQVTAGVEYTRLQGIGSLDKDTASNAKAMPNVDTVMFTVAYNFG